MKSLILVVIILLYPALSHAAWCGAQVGRAEAGLPESTAAKLHHQPTRASVARAERRLSAALARGGKCVRKTRPRD
jgi:hypothetical protein